MSIRQPLSTWTAAAFVAVGAAIAWIGQDPTAYLLAASMGGLAFGTALLHASEPGTRWYRLGETLDHAFMQSTMAGMTLHVIGAGPLGIALGAVLAAVVLEVVMNMEVESAMGAYVVVWAPVGLTMGAAWWTLAALGVFGGALVLQRRGGDRAHSAWHILSAAAFLLLFLAGGGA